MNTAGLKETQEAQKEIQEPTGSDSSGPARNQLDDGRKGGSGTPAKAVTLEREAGWGDYFRCFTYAKKWDFLMMAAAAIAAIGAGVVSATWGDVASETHISPCEPRQLTPIHRPCPS